MITSTRQQTIAFTALCMGFFMVILDVTIVNVTLPTIARYFQTDLSNLQWVVDGYTLMFAGLLLLVGALSDYYGPKIIFQIGLLAFSITSLACALSPSIHALIIFRLIQGASGSLLIPPSLALINTIYKDEKKRASAIGTWAALGGMACASGPFLGGLITSFISWRAIFAVNLIIGIISWALITRSVGSTKPTSKRMSFDFMGQAYGFITILFLAVGLIEASTYGWESPYIIASFFIALASFLLFLRTESRVKHPMVPLNFFRNKIMSCSLFVAMILNLTFYGILFTMPFYFENARHYTVFITGLALLPLPGLAVIGSYLGGKFTGTIGAGKVIFIGMLIAAIGFYALLDIGRTTPAYVWIMIPFFAIGFGVSFTTPAMTFGAIHAVDESRAGIAAAVLNTVNQVGSLIGVAVFGTILALSPNLMAGMHSTLTIAGSLFVIAAVVSILVMRQPQVVAEC